MDYIENMFSIMKKCSHSGKGLTLWVLSKCFLRPWKVHRSVWKFPQTEQGSNLRGQGRGSCLRGQPEAASKIACCPYLLELQACWQWEMNVFAELISVEDSSDLGLWALSRFSMPTAYSRPSSTKFIYISDDFDQCWTVLILPKAFQFAKVASCAFWQPCQGSFFITVPADSS